jgi:hypothetical protein
MYSPFALSLVPEHQRYLVIYCFTSCALNRFSVPLGLGPMLRTEESNFSMRDVERFRYDKFILSSLRSSFHFHTIVPIFTLVVLVPPNPFISLLLSCKGPSKSLIRCDMHPVHRLSIPIGAKSVSNAVWWSCRPPFACIATAVKAKNATALLPLWILLAILVAVLIFFLDPLQVSHSEMEFDIWFALFTIHFLNRVVSDHGTPLLLLGMYSCFVYVIDVSE